MRIPQLDIFADFICPWCYLGIERLALALPMRGQFRPTIGWQAFQLMPEMPPGGMEHQQYTLLRYGSIERAERVERFVREAMRELGTPYAMTPTQLVPPTDDAHRLAFYAAKRRRLLPMVGAVYRAYFAHGRDIADVAVLADIAGAVGFDPVVVYDYLIGEEGFNQLLEREILANEADIIAVPTFLFDRRYCLSGAQDPKSFLPLIDVSALAVDQPGSAAQTAP